MIANSLQARGLASLVHQQTDLHRHAREGAVLIERGEGCRVWDTEGREYIEAMAGLWCASLGFSERRLADAAHRQMLRLPYYHTFFGKGHGPAVELAERLLAVAPPGMARVLFQCSGSEANDAAIKLAWHTKAGLEGLMRALAVELAPHGIRCNCVAPGAIDTVRGASAGALPARLDGDAVPLRRKGTADEIAEVVRLLVGPEGGYVTGQTVHVNGGAFLT